LASELDETEVRGYHERISGHVENLLNALGNGNIPAALQIIPKFLATFVSGTKLPSSLFMVRDFLECLSKAILVPDLFDPVCFLLARMVFYCDDLSQAFPDSFVVEFLDLVITSRPVPETHAVTLLANLLDKRQWTPEFNFFSAIRERLGSITDFLKNRQLSLPHLIFMRNIIIIIYMDGTDAFNFLMFLFDQIGVFLSAEQFDLLHIHMFNIGDCIKGSSLDFITQVVNSGKLTVLYDLLNVQIPSVLEAVLYTLFYCVSQSKCHLWLGTQKPVHITGLPVDTVKELCLCGDSDMFSVQYEAIQLLRVVCEGQPEVAAGNGIIELVMGLVEQGAPFRLTFQAVWLAARFLYDVNPVTEEMSLIATALHFVVTHAGDDLGLAYVGLYGLLGLKWRCAFCHMTDAFKVIAQERGVDQFIMACEDMENDGISEILSFFETCDVIGSQSAACFEEIDEQMKCVESAPRIRFCVGGGN
jgi:hypothetical protein